MSRLAFGLTLAMYVLEELPADDPVLAEPFAFTLAFAPADAEPELLFPDVTVLTVPFTVVSTAAFKSGPSARAAPPGMAERPITRAAASANLDLFFIDVECLVGNGRHRWIVQTDAANDITFG